MYINSHGLFKFPDNQWTLKLFKGSEALINELSQYYQIWKKYGEKLGISATIEGSDESWAVDETFKNFIGKMHKHVSWHIGMMAYKLIKKEPKEKPAPENEEESEDVKKKKKIEKFREQLLQ